MNYKFTRPLSLLLVFVLAFGMVPTAMAAELGSSDAGALPEKWQRISDSLPQPITGYDPNDPDNPYPYGVPVDTFYPEEVLAADPYGISLMALDQSYIPDEMQDNAILRALEYTGYDVQYLKDNGYLYVQQYTGSSILNYAPNVLSDIGYWESGACPNGDETVKDSSTVSGKAPKISYFKSNGLVCASFVTYYLCNYLPNIEGVDTSMIYEQAKEYGADSRYEDVYYLTTVSLWKRTLDTLANQTGSGVTKYTSAEEAYQNLVPGDVIVFSNDGNLKHIAIYAGTCDFYSTSGTNRGKYHFIIHVGNSRGPEISTVEYMGSTGAKSSYPTAWYHLDVNDVAEATGFIEVNKSDPNGNALAGAYFVATNQSTQDKFIIGPTNSKGYAKSGELPLGTYVVEETVFPEGYTSSGQTKWTVTLTEDTPNMTITINAVNKLITGKARIVKKATNGGSVAGWHFEVKDSNGTLVGSFETDASGVIALDLEPGTYTVTETDAVREYWVNDPTPTRTVTVKADETATVTFTNQWIGQAQIIKTATNGGSVAGWHFEVKDANGTVIGNYVTDETGVISLDLNPGTYTVTETDGEYEYWLNDPNPVKTVTVKAGETASVTFQNQWMGKAKIIKTTTNGGTVEGWEFTITDTDGNAVGTYTTDATGIIMADLNPGTYTVQETACDDPYWNCDTEPQTITVKAGETVKVTFENQWFGKAKIIKTLANPEAGTAEGWTFTIMDASGKEIGTYQTDSEGTILTDLEPGTYTVTEVLEDHSLWQCTTENPQTVTVEAGQTAEVTFTNALRPGEIRIQKVDTKGEPLDGVEFLLEWSEDGVNWSPVTYTDSVVPQIGGCTTEGLTNGRLVSSTDGLVTFSGLHPTLQYHLTETATKDGYQLLKGYAYEGNLPAEHDLTVTLTVVNAEIFTMPKTGSNALTMMPAALVLCLGVCMVSIVSIRKKEV